MLTPRLILTSVLAVGLVAGIGASSGTSPKPLMRFTAFAVDLNRTRGAATANVDLRITRWSTDAERNRLLTTLLERGPQKLLEALRDTLRTGTIRTPDSLAYDLHYAWRMPLPDGGERIVLVTDRPIGFWEASRQLRSLDYPFTVIELRIGSNGEGEGKLSIATKVTAEKDSGTIVLENYNISPVMLNKVRREDY
jgi:hypothetical protein